MPLPQNVVTGLHGLRERLKRKEKLDSEDREFLHSVGAEYTSEIAKAVRILLSHDPENKRVRKALVEDKHRRWRELPEENKKEIIARRIEASTQRSQEKAAMEEDIKRAAKDDLDQKLRQVKAKGLSPMFTHYLSSYSEDSHGDPVNVLGATTCLLLDTNGNVVAKGVSLVSYFDNGSKLEGRLISLDRAQKAYLEENDSLPVNRWEADDVLNATDYLGVLVYKAMYKPSRVLLSDVESERLGNKLERLKAL